MAVDIASQLPNYGWQIMFWGSLIAVIIFFIVGIFFFMYFMSFRHTIEINTPTGNNFVDIREYKAKKKKVGGFTEYQLFMRTETIMAPNNLKQIYKKGNKWVIRLYKHSETESHPISMGFFKKARYEITGLEATELANRVKQAWDENFISKQEFLEIQRDIFYMAGKIITEEPIFEIEEEHGMKYKPIPQNSLLWGINKMKQVMTKYGRQNKLLEFAPVIGIGIVAVVFIVTIVLTIEHLNSAEASIASMVQQTAQLAYDGIEVCRNQIINGKT